LNNRRKLVIALGAGGGALTAPFALFAQQSQDKIWRVGYLSSSVRPDSFESGTVASFRRGLRELGYVEGRNLLIEWRFAEGKNERLPSLVAELLQLKVDVLLASGTPSARAAQKATTTIPIVMGSSGDPVGVGLIKSLARPEGNITGLTNISGDISSKHLQMLLDMVPKLSRVAVLLNPTNAAHAATLKSVAEAAQKIGVRMLSVEARTPQEIETAFSTMSREKAGAVIMENDSVFNQQARQIAEIAMKYRLPSIHGRRDFPEAGGLMSYGPSFDDMFRRAATYVDKIFKGAKPADLPVEQPTLFELIINGKTAKALGLKIPQSLLVMTDKVIE
jgi:putative ABC transport system substrate-binding protein